MVQHKAQDVGDRPRTEDIKIEDDIVFKSMLLPKPILQGLKKSGYIKPSPIQKKALPLVRCGLDLIVQAKAGTGKTCVFALAALELVQPHLPHLQVVVLAPTREIALQITDVFKALGGGLKGLKTCCFIGGYPISQDIDKAKGCQIAVGAPGRLRHLMDKELLDTRHVRMFVLDEADKLLEDCFADDVNVIYSHLPESKQVLSFSATYTEELISSLSCYMQRGQYVSPELGSSGSPSTTLLLGIRQYVSILPHHVDRLAKLRLKEKQLVHLLKSVPFNQCMVFSNLHSRALSICNMLKAQGFSADWIAGKQAQVDRVSAITQLKKQRIRVLVTTDLTARGIDAENVNLIINLDVPLDHQTYLHRMGRAGRYGSHGMVLTLVFDGEELTAFQKLLGAIGGTSQAVNCVPNNLKNIDLWTVPEDQLNQVYGVVEGEKTDGDDSYRSDVSTDTEERISPQTSDELESLTSDLSAVQVNDDSSKQCSCGLYNVRPSDVEEISGSSLFCLSTTEDHWRNVLPIVISENSLPLNIPVAAFGSKLVRVKHSNRSRCQINDHNQSFSSESIIKFQLECDKENFLTFEEINASLSSSSYLNDKHVPKKSDCKFDNDCDDVYEKIKHLLSLHEENVNKRKNLLMGFDSFDLVGWMAVDESRNILDQVKTENCDIFEFAFIKCPMGQCHINVVPPFSPEIRENNNCENHISNLNLLGLELEPPICLSKVADKFSSMTTSNLTSSLTSEVNGKDKTIHRENNVKKSQNNGNYYNRNGTKQKGTNSDPSKFSHNQNGENEEKKSSEKNGHNENIISSNEPKSSNYMQRNKQHYEKEQPLKNSKKQTISNISSVSKSVPKVNNKTEKYNKSSQSNDVKTDTVYLKGFPNRKKISTESTSDISSSSSKGFDPYLGKNGDHSSLDSEDSGPYVDMTKNLAKLQELHDFDEYNSGSSSESDVLGAVGLKVQSVSRKVSPEVIRDKEARFKNKSKYENQRFYEESSDSSEINSESNLSNHHSFQTARSCSDGNQESHSHRKTTQIHPQLSNINQRKCKKPQQYSESIQFAHCSYTEPNLLYTNSSKCVMNDTSDECRRKQSSSKKHHKQKHRTANDFTRNPNDCLQQDYQIHPQRVSQNSGMLRSSNLFADWYATWYSEVRQRAQQLEFIEYIETMSSP